MIVHNGTRKTAVVLAALALAGLACGPGGLAPNLPEPDVIEQLESELEELEELEGVGDIGISASDDCPVPTNAEVQAATGQAVTLNVVVDSEHLLGCTFASDGTTVSLQVFPAESPEMAVQIYEAYALVPGFQGQDVSGPWEQGRFSTQTGLIYQSGTNAVIVLTSDDAGQAVAVQIGTAVAARLPWVWQAG